jgi:hypothetical protein
MRRIVLALTIIGLFAASGYALYWRSSAPLRELAAARALWASQPVAHYQIVARMVGWGGCTQDAAIRYERIDSVALNTCRYHSPRSVTALFDETERFLRGAETGLTCRRGMPGKGCACYIPYGIEVRYNAQRGYVEQLVVSWASYAPNRAHMDYWRYWWEHGREISCGGPLQPPGRHIVVDRFQELP